MDNNTTNLKCCRCQQPATICYTEVNCENTIRLYLCTNCPKPNNLYDISSSSVNDVSSTSPLKLECGQCKSLWDPLSTNITLGCNQCYTNFRQLLIKKLSKEKLISSCFIEKQSEQLHIGRLPGDAALPNPVLKLIALTEALKETLEHEDYEQAAILRDQIQKLKQQNHDQ